MTKTPSNPIAIADDASASPESMFDLQPDCRNEDNGLLEIIVSADSAHCRGSDADNLGGLRAKTIAMHDYGMSPALTLPPLAVGVIEPEHAAVG
jgi:hypothetical protein